MVLCKVDNNNYSHHLIAEMKYKPRVSSTWRKNGKHHLTTPALVRRVFISALLSSNLGSKCRSARTLRSKSFVGPTKDRRPSGSVNRLKWVH
ncbi:Uncharacterized protein TCM_044197 [Theobroma cacao]|uniref:Uncharacterized protein n=1 Tax=Theobroma cacao TaxID=3641 RepID=A0A061FWR3_THECC|nr:Uncharacterized protein TCM_044197 [Theobroma cacao]